jgi:hypothetical protein
VPSALQLFPLKLFHSVHAALRLGLATDFRLSRPCRCDALKRRRNHDNGWTPCPSIPVRIKIVRGLTDFEFLPLTGCMSKARLMSHDDKAQKPSRSESSYVRPNKATGVSCEIGNGNVCRKWLLSPSWVLYKVNLICPESCFPLWLPSIPYVPRSFRPFVQVTTVTL